MAKITENSKRGTKSVLLFSASLLAGAVIGGWFGGGPEPLAAIPHCDESECEHNHRWWWFDSDECVDNSGQNTVCAPPLDSDHDCSTRACSDYHKPHTGTGDDTCVDDLTTPWDECI